jgi:hypothetical protein
LWHGKERVTTPRPAATQKYPHFAVKCSVGEYVLGAIHTQTIDGFWSLIKRGIMGTFHKVSARYLPLYMAEFSSGITSGKCPICSARR